MKIVRKIENRLPNFDYNQGLQDYSSLLSLQRATEYDKYDNSMPQLEVNRTIFLGYFY